MWTGHANKFEREKSLQWQHIHPCPVDRQMGKPPKELTGVALNPLTSNNVQCDKIYITKIDTLRLTKKNSEMYTTKTEIKDGNQPGRIRNTKSYII